MSQYHLIFVNYAYQPDLDSPQALLVRYYNLPGWAQACADSGCKVTVFQRFGRDLSLTVDAVDYRFVSDNLAPTPRYWQCALGFNRQVKDFVAALSAGQVCLHINGLVFPASVWHLTNQPRQRVNMVIQHHAELPRGRFFNLLNRWANKSISHYFFTTHSHAQPWIEANIVPSDKVIELMECSSNCQPGDKTLARQKLNQTAQPLLLWTANLDANKDPLTILAGFEWFLADYPQARLLMLYQGRQLLAQVKAVIGASQRLKAAVELVGAVSYQQINDYYNAADIFVQGSAREGSGIAVLDALACGAIPVISNISSFATLTGNGRVGRLFPRGDSQQLYQALVGVMNEDLQQHLQQQQQACIEWFGQCWTFEQLAAQALPHYFSQGVGQ